MHPADAEFFSEALIDYLKSRGWSQMESGSDIAVLRKEGIDQEEEIVLPKDRTYADYQQRVQEAVQCLAKHEGRLAGEIIKELLPRSDVSQEIFVGKVINLQGKADEQGTMQGEATLALFIDDKEIKAKAVFASEFYSLACDAHKQNHYVRISGTLSEKPRGSGFKDVSSFEII
jgi:hypothetical protein